jgi:tetratricopeptide (TPR) repeat protein
VALRADIPESYDVRGLAHLRRGDPAAARADYEAALKLRPQMASARYGHGLAELKLGRAAEGHADLAAAARLDPKIAADYARFGMAP